MIRISRDSMGKRKCEVIMKDSSGQRKEDVSSKKRKEDVSSKLSKEEVPSNIIRISRDSKGRRKCEVIMRNSSGIRKEEISPKKSEEDISSERRKDEVQVLSEIIRILRDSKGRRKCEVIMRNSSGIRKEEVSSKRHKEDISSKKLEEGVSSKKSKEDVSSKKSKEDVSSKKREEDISSEKRKDEVQVLSEIIRISRDSKGRRKCEVIMRNSSGIRKEEVSSKKHKEDISSKKLEEGVSSKISKEDVSSKKREEDISSEKRKEEVQVPSEIIRISRDSKGRRKCEVIMRNSSGKRKEEISPKKSEEDISSEKRKDEVPSEIIRISRDSKGKRKCEVIIKNSSGQRKEDVSFKKRKLEESSNDSKGQCRGQNNRKQLNNMIVDEVCLEKKSRDGLSIFKNEPEPLKYKNAYDMYKKDPPKEKNPIQSLTQWKSVVGWQHIVYEKEFDELARTYKMKMDKFLKSLSAEDLELYFKLKILEKKARQNSKKKSTTAKRL